MGGLFFLGAGGPALSLIQGIAAGAMPTMIARTMLPDACFKDGPEDLEAWLTRQAQHAA